MTYIFRQVCDFTGNNVARCTTDKPLRFQDDSKLIPRIIHTNEFADVVLAFNENPKLFKFEEYRNEIYIHLT